MTFSHQTSYQPKNDDRSKHINMNHESTGDAVCESFREGVILIMSITVKNRTLELIISRRNSRGKDIGVGRVKIMHAIC